MNVTPENWLTCRVCARTLRSANGLHAHLRGAHDTSAFVYYVEHPEALRLRIVAHTQRVQVVDGMTPCWEWTGLCCRKGYGRMRVAGGPTAGAHRYAMFVRVGNLDAEVARHRCDNPPCCNPEHLEPGTQLQNVVDRNERGRTAVGTATGSGQLTGDQVAMIRFRAEHLNESYRVIAEDFPVDRETVRRAALGQTYKNSVAELILW